MSEMYYHFMLATVTTFCTCIIENKISTVLFAISSVCWWLLFIMDIFERFIL